MFDQKKFGSKIREIRKRAGFTQKETAFKIGASEQAVSKWEKGECLPDVYNLKLLSKVYRVSVDFLLDTENESPETIVDTIKVGNACFELVEKTASILAGRIIYAKNYPNIASFDKAIAEITQNEEQSIYASLKNPALPLSDIHLSINFWKRENSRAFGFVREVTEITQLDGIDLYKNPPSLYIRAYTNKDTAELLAKDKCEIWELFSYIRNFLMPANNLIMANNGAQELEIFDTPDHTTGWAYMPVKRKSNKKSCDF